MKLKWVRQQLRIAGEIGYEFVIHVELYSAVGLESIE